MRYFRRRIVQREQLLRLAEHAHAELSLRIDGNKPALGFGESKHRLVNPVAHHRLDKVEILLEGVLIDLDAVGLELLAELLQHRVVDDEVERDASPAGRRLRDARIAGGRKPLREVLELLTCKEHPTK